jgi:predicted esterase
MTESLIGKDVECFAYFEPSNAVSITKAIDDLAEYVASEGPFDGVLGFSQGATLAASLLARNAFPPPFAFAVFICASPPFSPHLLDVGIVRYHDPAVDGEVLKLPATIIVGAQDAGKDGCVKLAESCQKITRTVFEHEGGHEIPARPKEITQQMAAAVQKTIAQAVFAH